MGRGGAGRGLGLHSPKVTSDAAPPDAHGGAERCWGGKGAHSQRQLCRIESPQIVVPKAKAPPPRLPSPRLGTDSQVMLVDVGWVWGPLHCSSGLLEGYLMFPQWLL
jgi:hypothetical protein